MKNETKEKIADALMQEARYKEIGRISVTEICRKAGCTKQTFYNHFCDKYDAVAWIFSQSAYRIEQDPDHFYTLDMLEKSLTAIWQKRDFFRVAFASEGQNSLREYIHQRDVAFNRSILCKAEGITEPASRQMFALKYHSFGCIGFVKEWLESEHPVSARELAEMEYRYMPAELKKAWAARPDTLQEKQPRT